jgi:hypothetical protein
MSSDDTAVERISSFISGNKRGVIIGAAAAALAVGGVAYYVASSRVGGGAGDEESLGGAKKKDKKRKKHKRSVKDKDGPILEEKKPKVAEESDDGQSSYYTHSPASAPTVTDIICVPDQVLTEEQIKALETGVSMPSGLLCCFAFVLSRAPIHSSNGNGTGTQVARGVTEAKGQRRVPGPKVRRRRSILHARHRRLAPAGARLLQQSRRVLCKHGTTTARKRGGGLRRGAQARLALRQGTQQEGNCARGARAI